ncbi:hypothetical protein EBB07_09485 [Paenibacillaceae bacterium]|nr:hypothetical protein EBB07_09485 [Paenibacillaceae bacterium]
MKKLLAVFVIILATVLVYQPIGGQAASTAKEIDRKLAELKEDMKLAEENKQQAEEEMQIVETQKQETAQSINDILDQIDNVIINMQSVSSRLEQTETELIEAGQSLEEAELRIETRDKLLQQRIRLMYTNGSVSYLDVLLSSTSFSDFLDRFDTLQTVMKQDTEILADHQRDKELIIAKKLEIEEKLAEVTDLYGRLGDYHELLSKKEEEKELMLAKFDQQMVELQGISEEQEKLLIALAKRSSDLQKEKNRIETYYDGGGKLLRPIGAARTSSPFGARVDPITGKKGKMHNGMDFAAPQGSAIYAAESGVVIVAQKTSGYGNTIIIDHGGGMWTLYAHIRNGGLLVSSGDQVKRGQKIAEVGNTGRSTGPHLHFEVRINEKPVNPHSYLK